MLINYPQRLFRHLKNVPDTSCPQPNIPMTCTSCPQFITIIHNYYIHNMIIYNTNPKIGEVNMHIIYYLYYYIIYKNNKSFINNNNSPSANC